jgi:hypothetical protein
MNLNRVEEIAQMPSGKLIGDKSQTTSGKSAIAANTTRSGQPPHFQLRRKREVLVEQTLPKDDNIHTSQSQLSLPSKADLKRQLMEWVREKGEP